MGLKMHVLCKVGKNIIFQNKTLLVIFYRHNKTFWYQFCNFKHFLKAENSEDSLASSCVEFSIGLSCNPGWDWVTIGTIATPIECVVCGLNQTLMTTIGSIHVGASPSLHDWLCATWIQSTPRFPYKSTVNIICTHVEAVQKQLEIFLVTCLQNLLVFSNQVQIQSNIRLVQKAISKIVFRGDKIRWYLEQKIPQQQIFHLACLYAHNAFGFSHTL